MTDHTPTPWECDWGTIPPDGPGTYCDVYTDGGDTIIARVNDCIERGHANAAFIVKAVNNHEALVKALKLARDRIKYLGVVCRDPRHFEANAEIFLPAIDEVLGVVGCPSDERGGA